MPKRIPRWFKEHPNLFAFLLMTIVFIYTTASFASVVDKQQADAAIRKKAFCSLIYLFDQSIKLQGTTDLGPLQQPYDDFKVDAKAIECEKKPDIVVGTTTTTTGG